MLDTKKLFIGSVVAIVVLCGVGYHLMQKLEKRNVDEHLILSKSNIEQIIAGKTVELHNNKDYDVLIKRAIAEDKDFVLRDILSEQEYQYLKNVYFKKVENKLLEFENKRNEVKEQATDIINQSKHEFKSGNMTQTKYRNLVKNLKIAQTLELQQIEKQKDFFISKRPFLERAEIAQLIYYYYKNTPNITTQNNDKVRSLVLSQILEGRGKAGTESNTYLAFDEILLNIKAALKDKKIIFLKDLLPKYEAEIYFNNLLNSPNYKTENKLQKLTTLRMKGLNHKLYGEYLAHMYVALDKGSSQFKEIEKEVTKLFTFKNIELLKQRKQQKSL